ncbi:MAG TPA: PilZ domain-containing protein [Candidatus Solibacter sp.]|nr:PilZ domain-containing protein [Candidatus Solibacter sp.]
MTEAVPKPSGAERRRSERVFLQIGIFVQGVSSEGHAFREKTQTLAVNAHGALIHLAQDVRSGDQVTLTNGYTSEQQACRVVYAKPMTGNVRAVGVEFVKPSPKFWGIDFPPADWKPFEE